MDVFLFVIITRPMCKIFIELRCRSTDVIAGIGLSRLFFNTSFGSSDCYYFLGVITRLNARVSLSSYKVYWSDPRWGRGCCNCAGGYDDVDVDLNPCRTI